MQTIQNTLSYGNIESPYDYVFCGLGASASLLLMSLHANGMLKDKKVLLIDATLKNNNDKTYCFWAEPNEPIVTTLMPLISKIWTHEQQGQNSIVPLDTYQYYHIRSIDLYDHLKTLAQQNNWEILIDRVERFSTLGLLTNIWLSNGVIVGRQIFDSRPPKVYDLKENQVHLHQSFVGWRIKTQKAVFDPKAFTFMDFKIEQNGSTQFVYVLPFSSNEALVEVTRFGSNKIQQHEAETILASYIQLHYGNYHTLSQELGCIPMCNGAISHHPSEQRIQNLGARNYQIKPSTGYAFKNMFYQAQEISSTLSKQVLLPQNQMPHKASTNSRFAFYDGLLLTILNDSPKKGSVIFEALLKAVPLSKTLKFLDEKTSLLEELSIFAKLPWMPFIKALFKHFSLQQSTKAVCLLLVSIILLSLKQAPAIQSMVGWTLFTLGMIWVGIPHGAIDHIIHLKPFSFKRLPPFIFNYLFVAAAMGMVWIYFPMLALVIFLFYSSWHFGQGDSKAFQLGPLESLAWGASVLLFILGTHAHETMNILNSMRVPIQYVDIPIWAISPWVLWSIFRKNIPLFITTLWLLLSSGLPLIFSFGLYFIGQHSLNGWQHIQSRLQLSGIKLWQKALPFHLGAWILFGVVYVIWPQQPLMLNETILGMFFIFISCISFPHVLVMHRFYQ